MVTKIAQVRVTRTEAGGHMATCDQCPNWRHIRAGRLAADELAIAHQASHGRMDPADNDPDLQASPW